ncbi:hypothetical protein AK830_g6776 [Neonectria ditissima]|uniref:Putative gamma-glutamylcyclotransferase n=1 Tax=Neonectria ditissima TaxID=78410 RepID=A0A0P7B147_9HYPO|nr:hypothetical protein AK830_g6776 [Neonectria ditissima]
MSSERGTGPLFICGPLCSPPLLAWILTGDTSKADEISKLMKPVRLYGYEQYTVKLADHPALIKVQDPLSSVDGFLLENETTSQRQKLNDFEGEMFQSLVTSVHLLGESGEVLDETAEAEIYLWAGKRDCLSYEPWSYDDFVKERLHDWIALFERVSLGGCDY